MARDNGRRRAGLRIGTARAGRGPKRRSQTHDPNRQVVAACGRRSASLAIAVERLCGTSTASPSTAPSAAAAAHRATPRREQPRRRVRGRSVVPGDRRGAVRRRRQRRTTRTRSTPATSRRSSAPDAKTVVFDLCSPDVAFLAKVAFSVVRHQRLRLPGQAHAADRLDRRRSERHRPVHAPGVRARATDITMVANPNYWGDKPAKAPTLIFNWSNEAAQRLVELQAGHRRRHRQRRHRRLRRRSRATRPEAVTRDAP